MQKINQKSLRSSPKGFHRHSEAALAIQASGSDFPAKLLLLRRFICNLGAVEGGEIGLAGAGLDAIGDDLAG